MKINQLKCRQFAGITRKDYTFDDHLNLLVGKNESGKSTLVDLLYSLFFESVANTIPRDFKGKYFPKTTGAHPASSVDGTVCFTGKDGLYELSRRWEDKTGRSELSLPDDTLITGEGEIAGILSEELGYGKGIFDEFIFPSQRRGSTALQGLLTAKGSDSVKALAAVISRAVMSTGGLDISRIEEALRKKISALDGHWDFSRNLPERASNGAERGITNRWQRETGTILEAYYAREEARRNQKDAENKEMDYERATREFLEAKEKQREYEDRLTAFTGVRVRLEKRKNALSGQEQNRKVIQETKDALKDWPEALRLFRSADTLRKELTRAKKKQQYDRIKVLLEKQTELQKALEQVGEVDPKDVTAAKQYIRDIDRAEARLSGMKLTARIDQLGKEPIILSSLVTGEEKQVSGDVRITEAVRLSIPGIADISLLPEGVDPDALQQTLSGARDGLKGILEKYDAESVEKLEEKQQASDRLQAELRTVSGRITDAKAGCDWDSLKQEVRDYPEDLRPTTDVERDIVKLCPGENVETFCGRVQSRIDSYEKRYGNMDELQKACDTAIEKDRKYESDLEEVKDIPYEFLAVEDPDRYEADLKGLITTRRESTERLASVQSDARRELPDISAEEWQETFREKDDLFEQELTACGHWKHILEVFLRLKNEMQDNPVEDIEKAFREYLSVLSESRLELTDINEKLESSIVSGTHPLSMEILSEGTKDTISLAFRLAVLEHLYPEGGAVAVFDDPFTDMDPVRVQEACRLIRKFSEKNQVIFVTCDDKYRELLGGNVLSMDPA